MKGLAFSVVALVVLAMSPRWPALAVDFSIEEIDISRAPDGGVTVGPVYAGHINDADILALGGPILLEWDIFINNAFATRVSAHRHRPTPPETCGGPGCSGACSVDILEGGEVVETLGGGCFVDTFSSICACFYVLGSPWNVSIPARGGDVIRIVLDPDDIVPEDDESNNVMQRTITVADIPTISDWGLIALATSLLAVGLVYIAVRSRAGLV